MLKVKLLHPDAKVPTCANPGEDLGFDLYALEDTTLVPGVLTKVKTGIAATYEVWCSDALCKYGLLIRDRSSMASKGIIVNGGVVDAGYRGEIIVMLTKLVQADDLMVQYYGHYVQTRFIQNVVIKKGDKIAQMIPLAVYTQEQPQVVDVLPEAARGAAGFGSTGR